MSLATVVPIPIPITNTNPFAISSFKLFSQRIQSLGLSLMSLTSFLGATKERPTLKRDGATSRHLVGYRIPMVDGRLSWKRHLLTTNVLSSCFFCSHCSYIFFHPNQVQSLVAMIIIFAKEDNIYISVISSRPNQQMHQAELFIKRQSHISHSIHSCATVDSGQTFKS